MKVLGDFQSWRTLVKAGSLRLASMEIRPRKSVLPFPQLKVRYPSDHLGAPSIHSSVHCPRAVAPHRYLVNLVINWCSMIRPSTCKRIHPRLFLLMILAWWLSCQNAWGTILVMNCRTIFVSVFTLDIGLGPMAGIGTDSYWRTRWKKSGCLFCATMFELRCLFCEPAHTRTLIRSLRASTIPKVVVTTIFSLGYRIILLNDAYVYFAAYILIWSDQNYELMARYDWDGWKAWGYDQQYGFVGWKV